MPCPVPSWPARGSAARSSDRIRMIDLQPLVPLAMALPLALAIPNLGAPCRVTQQFPSKSGVAPAPPSPPARLPKMGHRLQLHHPASPASASARHGADAARHGDRVPPSGPAVGIEPPPCVWVCVCGYVCVHVSRFLSWSFLVLDADLPAWRRTLHARAQHRHVQS